MRQGSNGLVCFRVVPGEAAWDARCYEATMARLIFRAGELRRMVQTNDSIDARIRADVRAETLTLPAHPAAGYRVLGGQDSYDRDRRGNGANGALAIAPHPVRHCSVDGVA